MESVAPIQQAGRPELAQRPQFIVNFANLHLQTQKPPLVATGLHVALIGATLCGLWFSHTKPWEQDHLHYSSKLSRLL
jgi:hypothetical protein